MTIEEATKEYHALLSLGIGLPVIVKMFDIPPYFECKYYGSGGIWTEPHVIAHQKWMTVEYLVCIRMTYQTNIMVILSFVS